MPLLRRLHLLLGPVLLLACGAAAAPGEAPSTPTSPPSAGAPPSVSRQITPSTTDPAIDVANDPHVAVNPAPSVAARGKLLLFLPGTGAVPTMQQLILGVAAARGYHAIGLTYPNPTPVGVLCGDDVDAECFWDVRREVITGLNTSPRIQITPANAIVNRLEKLLAYLSARYPTEQWGTFLVDGKIDWSRVTLAGHSQGGGHVGVLAKLVSLDRAVYFSSPADWRQTANASAAWLSRPNVTPASRQYAFIHEQDQLVPVAQARANWTALGLGAFGAITTVDGASSPFGASHQLLTRATPLLAGSFHGATVVDAATPRAADGSPLFAAVWGYLALP